MQVSQNGTRDQQEKRKIRRIAVLGGGTAGLLTAITLQRKLPDISVQVVRSTKMGVIGVGEGTIVTIVKFLHRYLGLNSRRFHERAKPSLKLGIKYLWGERPFFHYTFSTQLSSPDSQLSLPKGYYCRDSFDFADLSSALMLHDKVCLKRIDGRPKLGGGFSYHLENRTFVGYLEEVADECGIPKIDDVVKGVEQDEHGIQSLILSSGQRVEADMFVDASGFRSELLGKALGEEFVDFSQVLFCDRAVVGGWERTDESYHPYTTAETMDAGWCWQIEHDEIINRGYVFSSAFLSDDQAEAEYRRKNPRVDRTHVVSFPAGARRRSWVKNVVAIGNSAGFVEPLEATAIGTICDSVAHIIRALKASDGFMLPIQRDIYNRVSTENWEIIRDFLAIHYKFNGRLNTPFWQAARHDVDIGSASDIVEYFQAVGPDFRLLEYDMKRNFFTNEGFFAMLVGQRVPYQRKVSISATEEKHWQSYKQEISQAAKGGMGMAECLADLRKHGLPAGMDGDAFGMDDSDFGGLRWQ